MLQPARAIFLPGWLRGALLSLAPLALYAACETRRPEPAPAASANEPSPNASVLPAPLAPGATKTTARDLTHPTPDSSSAGVPEPPRPIREDDTLPPEGELRAAPGLSLEARLRWLDPPPARSPEANADGLARARDKTGFELAIDLSSLGRLRVGLSRAFPFPSGTELRARDDRFGHVLLWPGQANYTPLPPGTLRAVLDETRVDATPLSEPVVAAAGSGNLIGIATQRQRIENGLGRVELEQAVAPSAGSAGALLCRFVLELAGVAPHSAACRPEWVPLRAEYTWASGARLELEVTKLTRRAELPTEGLAVPPSSAVPRRAELPVPPFLALLEERELGELHSRALPPPDKPDPSAPKLGLIFQNRTDLPRYLLIDGVPVVWLRADAEWLVTGLKTGRYTVQTRDLFGAEASPPKVLELPARFNVGDEAQLR
ncbi:MAG TPA: hypothetical protein VHB79_26210 [Polyangiaceae bacterium]|nr:hypothetical protein [Polyangiaceae bacterium]